MLTGLWATLPDARAEEEELKCYSQNGTINVAVNTAQAVYVSVSYNPNDRSMFKIPAPLEKANLEQTLQKIYKQHFTVRPHTKPGCNGINNQEVHILDYGDMNDKIKFHQLSKKPGNLMAYLQVAFHSATYMGYPEGTDLTGKDIATLYLNNMRSNEENIDDYTELPAAPIVIPLSLEDQAITKKIEGYIKDVID